MTKQEAFNEINRTQDKYIEELVSLIESPEYENVRAISFTSATGTGKTRMMGKLIDRFPDYYFIVSTLSKGQLHIQVRNSLMKECHQNNFTVYGSADYKINSKLDATSIISKIPRGTRCIWLRDEGHIRTNRFDELLLDKCYKVINFSATNSHSDIQCNFTHTMMLRTVNQTNGSPDDAINKLLEIKKVHKDIKGYNPCAIFRCIGGDDEIYSRIIRLCKRHKLKYIDITDESFVMSELCEDDNKYDVIINKFKLVEGIDIRRAHVLYMDNQPNNNATTIQAIGRCRRNALLYRDDIDIFDKKNEELLRLTRECYVYYNVEKMKISTDADGELQYAFCNYISCESLLPGTTVDVNDGQLLNGLYVLELAGKTGRFNIIKDKETGFNVVEPVTDFYNNSVERVDNNYIYCDNKNYKIHVDNVKYLPLCDTEVYRDSLTGKFLKRDIEPYYRIKVCDVETDVPYEFSGEVLDLIKRYRSKYTHDYFYERVKGHSLDQIYQNVSAPSYDIYKLKEHTSKYVKENANTKGLKLFCGIISSIGNYKVKLYGMEYVLKDICTENELIVLSYFCVKKKEGGLSLDDVERYIRNYICIRKEWNEWKYGEKLSITQLFNGIDINAIMDESDDNYDVDDYYEYDDYYDFCDDDYDYRDKIEKYVEQYIQDNYANSRTYCEMLKEIIGGSDVRKQEISEEDYVLRLGVIFSYRELVEIQFACIKEKELYHYSQEQATQKTIEHIKALLDYKNKFVTFKNGESDSLAYFILSNSIKALYKWEIPCGRRLRPFKSVVDYPLSLYVGKSDISYYYSEIDNYIEWIFNEIRERGIFYLSAEDAVSAISGQLSYAERGFANGVIHRVEYYYGSLFEKTNEAEKILVKNEYINTRYRISPKELDKLKICNAYDKITNDKESSIIGVDLMRPINSNIDKSDLRSSADEMTWTESTSVSSKIGNYNKFNLFISQRYYEELEYAKEHLINGKNDFNLDRKCNSALGYCVEYYSKYLVYGKSYLSAEIKRAQKEARGNTINDYIIIRACMLKYRELMMISYGSGVSKVINTISIEQLLKEKYDYFVNLVVELGTRTADYVRKTLYKNKKAKNNIDTNLSIRHISGLADYITEDTILDVKVRNNIDEKCIRQVLAYHYLSTKRSDLNVKRVIVYDAVSNKAIAINISPANLTCSDKWENIRNSSENNELRYDVIRKSLNMLGFNVEEDFPDSTYYSGMDCNIDIIKGIVDESIEKGFDISIYKGLSTRMISLVFVCLENGEPAETAIGYAREFYSVQQLKEHFKKRRRKAGHT